MITNPATLAIRGIGHATLPVLAAALASQRG